jgi:hypothetical protein
MIAAVGETARSTRTYWRASAEFNSRRKNPMKNSLIHRIRSLLPGARHPRDDAGASRGADRGERVRFSWLDFKVGLRMLVRYPGLTVVGTAAIAVGIALGTLYFEALNKWQNPRLPIPAADRVVSIRIWDTNAVASESRSLHDFAIWREQVRTIDNLGAAGPFVRNLATEDGRVEPVRGAEVTADAFALMGTPPLLGRTLTEQDEQPAPSHPSSSSVRRCGTDASRVTRASWVER